MTFSFSTTRTNNLLRVSWTALTLLAAGGLWSAALPAGAAPVTWHGNDATNPTHWDIGTTANWNGSTAVYNNGDDATFDGTAAGFTVDLQTTVAPGSMVISSSGSPYVFNGGGISGSTGIVKTGSAAATFTQSAGLSFSGGTQLNSNSTINFNPGAGTSHSFGTGDIILNNAAARFEYNPAVSGSTLSNNFVINANNYFWRRPADPANTFGGTVTLNANITMGGHPENRNQLRETVILTGDRTIRAAGFSPVPVVSGQITHDGSGPYSINFNNAGDNPGWFLNISSPVSGGWDVLNIEQNITDGLRQATLRIAGDERDFFNTMTANGGYLIIRTGGVQFARQPTGTAEIGFRMILNQQAGEGVSNYGSGIRGNTAFDVVSGGELHGNGTYRRGDPNCCHFGTGTQRPYDFFLDVNVSGTGLISPGDPLAADTIDIMRINGNLAFNGGQLLIEVAGPGVAGVDYDQLIVQDSVTASGRGNVTGLSTATLVIDFTKLAAVEDLEGETLTVLTSLNNLSSQSFGDVITVGLDPSWVFDVVYGNGFVNLTNFQFFVPEPSTLLLLAVGAVGLAAGPRRGRRSRTGRQEDA